MYTSLSVLTLLLSAGLLQDVPPLPQGLGQTLPKDQTDKPEKDKDAEPSLPTLPSLPSGLGSPSPTVSSSEPTSGSRGWFAVNVTGFIEARGGFRLHDDQTQKDASISEVRAQLQTELSAGPAIFNLTADFVLDPVADDYAIDLEEGRGLIDFREANMVLRPLGKLDLKIGRQIATWGTGDLVFINDLFPKDYNSFFIGRDDEYLKAPSDALRGSLFTDAVNIEMVYTPRFDADRYIDGSRLSYLNPSAGQIAGRDAVIDPYTPDAWFDDDEIAVRLSRNVGAFELAAYGYDGFWKSPAGFNNEGRFTFPALAVFGVSIRAPLAGGIANAEFGYYDSKDDDNGSNPFLPNSQTRYLVGFEREAMPNLTIGLQYYAEHTEDYGSLVASLPASQTKPDETRHVVTTRITKLAYNQNLTLSFFNFYSPNQEDGYARARASYKLTDNWLVDGGVNIFYGEPTAFFGQFEDNTNAYVGVRRSF